MSRLSSTTVKQFFEREEANARRVLRAEMESLMDTIFGQMKQKFIKFVANLDMTTVDLNIQGDSGDQLDLTNQLYSCSNGINLSTTTINSHAQFGALNASNQVDIIPAKSNENNKTANKSVTASSTQSNDENDSPNSGIAKLTTGTPVNQLVDDEITVKNELCESVNIIKSELIDESIATSCTQSYEQSIGNDDSFEEEEDCDCPECVGELFVVKREDGEQEVIQLIEDSDEDDNFSRRPTKRPRLENDQAQANNQITQNRFITVSLKCPQCSILFNKDALNTHLKDAHSILTFLCLYKGCTRSFNSKIHLGDHYRTTHCSSQSNSMWPCGHCSRSFNDHTYLLNHYLVQHQEGVFRCCRPNCQFVSKLRQTVDNHFVNIHQQGQYACQHPGCARKYRQESSLRIHERTHRVVDRTKTCRSYRCKWPQCTFAGHVHKGHVLKHIHKHLMQAKRQNTTTISNDPNDYLDVAGEL